MFRLSKKSDYGLIAMKHLALHSEESVSAREIAAQYHIPAELLAKVLQQLARKGLLVSQQGMNGGYVLARDPARISIVDVVEALEGPISITPCERGDDCQQIADVLGSGSFIEDQSEGRPGTRRHLDLRTGNELRRTEDESRKRW